MTEEELIQFLKKHKMTPVELAELLGLTRSAVDHWVKGIRSIAKPYGRIIRLFDKYPRLMKEFI